MRTLTRPLRILFSKKRVSRKKGQTLVEYAIVLCVVTGIALGVFFVLGKTIAQVFSGIDVILDTAQSS